MRVLSALRYNRRDVPSGKAEHSPSRVAFAALCCAALVAACGSSSASHNGSNARFVTGVKFADCMRSHGVPNFPDPGAGGGGIQIPVGSGINPQSPAFQSAQTACFKLMPGGGPLHGTVSETRKLAMLHLAQCMRRHGLTTFPDPTANPPAAPPAGGGIAFGGPGSFISVPATMMQSPGFNQAAAACGFPGFGPHRGAKQAALAP